MVEEIFPNNGDISKHPIRWECGRNERRAPPAGERHRLEEGACGEDPQPQSAARREEETGVQVAGARGWPVGDDVFGHE